MPPLIGNGMLTKMYVLDGHVPRLATSLKEWSASFTETKRRVGLYVFKDPPIAISTIFLGIDHRFAGTGPPILFETMIFGNNLPEELQDYQRRCCTWEEAEKQHLTALREIKNYVLRFHLNSSTVQRLGRS